MKKIEERIVKAMIEKQSLTVDGDMVRNRENHMRYERNGQFLCALLNDSVYVYPTENDLFIGRIKAILNAVGLNYIYRDELCIVEELEGEKNPTILARGEGIQQIEIKPRGFNI